MKYWLLIIEVSVALMIGIRRKSVVDGFIAGLTFHFIWGVSGNFLEWIKTVTQWVCFYRACTNLKGQSCSRNLGALQTWCARNVQQRNERKLSKNGEEKTQNRQTKSKVIGLLHDLIADSGDIRLRSGEYASDRIQIILAEVGGWPEKPVWKRNKPN